jgi:hypothetical protein
MCGVCVAVVRKCVCVYLLSQQWRRDEKRLPHYTLNAAALFFSLSLSFLQAARRRERVPTNFSTFSARALSQPSKRITDNYPARQNSNTRNDIICCMVVGAHTHSAKATGQPRTGQRNGRKKPRRTRESDKIGLLRFA